MPAAQGPATGCGRQLSGDQVAQLSRQAGAVAERCLQHLVGVRSVQGQAPVTAAGRPLRCGSGSARRPWRGQERVPVGPDLDYVDALNCPDAPLV